VNNQASSIVVEQLRSVVEESGVFSQLAGAGMAEKLGWLAVHSVLLSVVVAALVVGLRIARSYYRDRVETVDDSQVDHVRFRECRYILWGFALVLGLCFATLVACDAVSYYQYCVYPRAMVLRDLLGRI
jgi:hypothetical protein